MSLEQITEAMVQQYGAAYAKRWLAEQERAKPELRSADSSPTILGTASRAATAFQEPFEEHSSHRRATELLEPFKDDLGAAYETLRLIARCSIEYASEREPAPHLMTTYWALEEMTGKCERTLIRHLVEDGHSWSETVRSLIDVRHNYGTMLDAKDEDGRQKERPVIVGTIIRFFPQTRLTPNAKVKKWGRRDLIADADEGRTRNTRPTDGEKHRYQRNLRQMSVYSSVKEQVETNNWLLVKVGQTISNRQEKLKNSASLYADIPRKHLLNVLRADLGIVVEQAQVRGANIKRARSLWVDTAAQLLSERFGDNRAPVVFVATVDLDEALSPEQMTRPVGYKERNGKFYPVYLDGFTNLWRRMLWTAVRAELYGNTSHGWVLLEKMLGYVQEAERMGKRNPVAWAWSVIKREGFSEFLRDFGTGAVGAMERAA